MSTEAQILALFKEGDPVPDPDRFDKAGLDATAYLAARRAGSTRMTKVEDKIGETERKRPPLVWLAAAAAMTVLIVGGVALMQTGNDDEAPPAATVPDTAAVETLTPDSLAGREFEIVGGQNQDLPTQLVLSEGGDFEVLDGSRTVDTGTYTIEGAHINFTSTWEEGRGPLEGDGILWAYPSCADCNMNLQMRADRCEGVVGEYELVFEEPTTVTLKIVNDACLMRNFVASGLQLVPASG